MARSLSFTGRTKGQLVKRLLVGFSVAAILSGGTLYAEFYKLQGVKRMDKDLYKASSPAVYIETRYCYHYTYGEDVIYNDSTDKVIWKDDSTCDVKRIFK